MTNKCYVEPRTAVVTAVVRERRCRRTGSPGTVLRTLTGRLRVDRRSSAVATAAATFCLLASCAPPGPVVPVTQLTRLDGADFGVPREINERGQVLVGAHGRNLGNARVWEAGELTELEIASANGVAVADISETGQVVGREPMEVDAVNRGPTGFSYQPVSWSDGRRTVLPTEGGTGWATAVNDRGVVVGQRFACPPSNTMCGDHPSEAWAWRDGEIIKAPPMPGRTVMPVDVNNQGQVLVNIRNWDLEEALFRAQYLDAYTYPRTSTGEWNDGYTAVWQIGGGITEVRPDDGIWWSWGVAINERGDVAGNYMRGGINMRGFLWRDGRWITLDAPDAVVTELGWDTSAHRRSVLNERGDVVGSVGRNLAPYQTRYQAALWRDGRLIELGPPGSSASRATAVNDRGQVVGVYRYGDGTMAGFIWQDGAMRTLGTPPSYQRAHTIPYDLNERGQIVGVGPPPAPDSVMAPLYDGSALFWALPQP